MSARWTENVEIDVALALHLGACDGASGTACPFWTHHLERARAALSTLADLGLLRQPDELTQAEADEAWRHNAKLHIDMRRRIQQVATHAAAEQRTLSWVADELSDILDDPLAWQGETAPP